MTKSKHTQRALLASVLSMILCMAMLIGSTFAWFTDSVVSGKNKIVAGNLDVELEYSTDGETWNTVGADTNLFKPAEGENATLWEPGHTEYVYLRVRNAGSLALRYELALNVYGDENGAPEKTYTSVLKEEDGVTNKTFKLSSYLVFSQTEGQKTVTKRDDLWIKDAEAEKAAMGKLDGLGKTKELLAPGAEEILTLAVYMPTQVGNEANQLTSKKETEGVPTIFLGLNLIATQTPYEQDSFNEQYDKDAWLALNAIDNGNGTYTNDDKTYVKDDNHFVEVTEDPAVDGLYTATETGEKYASTPDALATVAQAGGDVTAVDDIDLTESNSGSQNRVSVKGGAIDLGGNTLSTRTFEYGLGSNTDSCTVENGSIDASKLSTNEYNTINPVILCLNVKPDTIDLNLKNLKIYSTAETNDSYNILDLEGLAGKVNAKIDSCTVNGLSYFHRATVEISDSIFDSTGFDTAALFRISSETTLTITGGTYTSGNGELFEFANGVTADDVVIVITGGTFNVNPSAYVPETHQAVANDNGTWTVTAK